MLTTSTRDKIKAELEKYPSSRTALLPALKLAQDELGWLPTGAIAEVADLVGVSHAAAVELTTFYSMLRTAPCGRQRVEVCVQLPCALAGGERLLSLLADRLGIAPGETTPDGDISLIRTAECLGACHRAPMCRLNTEYVERLGTPEAVEALLRRLLKNPAAVTAKDAGGRRA
jgi:NADH-quinone oxidoreductase subunit E